MTTFTPYPDPMTGAELQTLREACGLSRDDLGALAGVAARSVKHWEHGRSGVPGDVADLLRRLDKIIEAVSVEAVDTYTQAIARHAGASAPADVVLIRYRDADHLTHYHPVMAGQPAGVHGAIVQRVAHALRQRGQLVRVVWMVPADYEAWRTAHALADLETTRATWAADQVAAQALPHRADQPPPGV